MSEEIPVRVRGLWHTFPGDIHALRGIDIDIHAGECVAILGQNGSGKTTLVKHFNGLLKPTRGTVEVFGRDTQNASTAQLARFVGYVYQNPDHQIFSDTVRQEIAFGPTNLELPKEEVEERVKQAIDLAGLSTWSDAYPFVLGKGVRERVAVASVLAMHPSLLIIDEPTTGMDFSGLVGVLHMLERLKDTKRSIITITHDMWFAARFPQRLIVMSNGQVLADGPTREVFLNEAILEKAFLRPPQAARLAQNLARFGIRPDCLSIEELFEEILRTAKQ